MEKIIKEIKELKKKGYNFFFIKDGAMKVISADNNEQELVGFMPDHAFLESEFKEEKGYSLFGIKGYAGRMLIDKCLTTIGC